VCATVATEELSTAETGRVPARMLGVEGLLPKPKHLNSQLYSLNLPDAHRENVQWLFGRLDWEAVATDEVYPLAYFANKFVAWTGCQIGRTEHVSEQHYRSKDYLAELLDKAEATLEQTLAEVRNMRRDLAS